MNAPIIERDWPAGDAPIAVVMISLNEAHNMAAVLENLSGFASEVFLVDSYSSDETVDIAFQHGVYVVQRRFRGFGDQWNFALRNLPISAPWTMKLDPDERLTEALKQGIRDAIAENNSDGFMLQRRLWFMGSALPATQRILRGWRTGICRFSDVLVNEHPLVDGRIVMVPGLLEHHDSLNLHHWTQKQNSYTTSEAISTFRGMSLSAPPSLFGSALQRRMWIKKNFMRLPFRYFLLHMFYLFATGAWRAGYTGRMWAHLRVEVQRANELKLVEMTKLGYTYEAPAVPLGPPHPFAFQADE